MSNPNQVKQTGSGGRADVYDQPAAAAPAEPVRDETPEHTQDTITATPAEPGPHQQDEWEVIFWDRAPYGRKCIVVKYAPDGSLVEVLHPRRQNPSQRLLEAVRKRRLWGRRHT